MTLSTLPLSYCSNVHPGLTVDEVMGGLTEFTLPVREQVGELAAGLWLAQPVIEELLATDGRLDHFAGFLHDHGLTTYTFNAFPYGNFHDARVKENVYLPDWTRDSRVQYTLDCARVLARLLPPDIEWGSLSTVPLGFKEFEHPVDFRDQCAQRLVDLAQSLSRLHDETGRTIRLAVEPEPFCVLETTDETLDFFQRLRKLAADRNLLDEVYDFIGVCYDVCHQAVEFEDVAASIDLLVENDIRINKVHISNAVELLNPESNIEGREALAWFVEPRYLHQTFAKMNDGRVLSRTDLETADVLRSVEDYSEFDRAEAWRIHFHVPVNADELGPLKTTRPDLVRAIDRVAKLDYAPHLEIETYTWEVLPDGKSVDLVTGLCQEITATGELLRSARNSE